MLLVVLLAAAGMAFPGFEGPVTAVPRLARGSKVACRVQVVDQAAFVRWGQVEVQTRMNPCTASYGIAVLDVYGYVQGRQFDRFGAMWINGVEVLRMTTPEPSEAGIQWHVEQDVSSYSALFVQPNMTIAFSVPNQVTSIYTGALEFNASISFYHRGDSTMGITHTLPLTEPRFNQEQSPWDQIAIHGHEKQQRSLVLPSRRMKMAVIDVFASGHVNEEFWYTNAPDRYARSHSIPGGGDYRELQLYIDGMLTGAEYPFPVVYSGGINPLLWRPLIGINALSIPSYRFDIAAFLGLLNDGKEHSFSVSVPSNDEKGVWYVDMSITYEEYTEPLFGGVTLIRSPTHHVGTVKEKEEGGNVFTTNGFRDATVHGVLFSANGSLNISTEYTIALRSKTINYIADDGQIGATLVELSSGTYRKQIHVHENRILEHETSSFYPMYVYTNSSQAASSFQIDAEVIFAMERRERWVQVRQGPKDEFDVAWTLEMEGAAVYNRSSENDDNVVEHGSTKERFQIVDSHGHFCFDRSLAATNGSVVSNEGKIACVWPNGMRFCQTRFCLHSNPFEAVH